LHAAIIGNGITGVTAALELRKLQPDWKISLISGESTYHYSRPALMYIFMGHMTYQDTKPYEDHVWADERIDLVRDWVTEIDTDGKQLSLHRSGKLGFDKLLLATGSKSNRFGWPGQDLDGVLGLYNLQDLKALHDVIGRAKHAVIVGGGLIGIELAEMLHSRGVHVTFLVREKSYWNNVLPAEESNMVNRIIRDAGFDLRLKSEMKQIIDDGNGRACAVETGTGERIECEIVGLTAGVSPNIDLVKDSSIETGRGIQVDWSLRTNIPDVFAAGDCAELVTEGDARNVLQQVWYTGKQQARVAAEVMAGSDTRYEMGIWYNSAKFLDLEYHTYGKVNLHVPDEQNLFWEHASGLHSIRIVYTDEGVIGFNTMGLRYKHRVCEAWIAEGRSVEYVLEHLSEANFDPEFFRRFESEAIPYLRSQLQTVVSR
jgi:NADPH-dependent 2,4-dienoyl-CoA reductase/sulfur reductase-like enzyme